MVKCPQAPADGSCQSCELYQKGREEAESLECQLRWVLDQIRFKILVMSGKGGVGKSSVAVGLALTLARKGFKVGLVDIDLHGPDVFRMLGIKEPLDLLHGQYKLPPDLFDNLKLVSIEALMPNREKAIIWRGPIKHKAIQQFLTEVEWGPLDFLILDSPPGTGDEPLTVAHTVPEAKAVIVSTPQEISLADVRKSVDFCQKVNLEVLGVVENMGHVVCPDCGRKIELFYSEVGSRNLEVLQLKQLGSLPFDPQVVAAADNGRLAEVDPRQSPFFQGLEQVTEQLLQALGQPRPGEQPARREPGVLKLAVPLAGGQVAEQLSQGKEFALFTVKDSQVVDSKVVTPPDFRPGILPAWLERQGVTHIFATQVKDNVRRFFARLGVEVLPAAPGLTPEALVDRFLGKATS